MEGLEAPVTLEPLMVVLVVVVELEAATAAVAVVEVIQVEVPAMDIRTTYL